MYGFLGLLCFTLKKTKDKGTEALGLNHSGVILFTFVTVVTIVALFFFFFCHSRHS